MKIQKYKSNNEINKQKYDGKKNVKGAFVKLNAGNVEHNVSMFNKGFASPDGGNAVGSCCAESLNESDATLDYDNIGKEIADVRHFSDYITYEVFDNGDVGFVFADDAFDDEFELIFTPQDLTSYVKQESLNEDEGDDSRYNSKTHQKYKSWRQLNKQTDEFTEERYTPYVTTNRIKRTLDDKGLKPVEATGIMLDVQRGNKPPRHFTLETQGEDDWVFRNEEGSKLFDLDEDFDKSKVYEYISKIFNYLNIDETSKKTISWNELMDAVVKGLGVTDAQQVVEIASAVICKLNELGFPVDIKENNTYQIQ